MSAKINVVLGALALAAAAGSALAQANNPCSGAVVVNLAGVGSSTTVNGTNVAATNDGPAGACAGLGRDVWYRITVPAAGQLSASTCGGAAFDSVIALYNVPSPGTPCPVLGPNMLACVDDSCGLQTEVTAFVAAGQTIMIRVGTYNAGAGGTFTLTVALNPPPPPPTNGPDVVMWNHTDIARYGTGTSNGITVAAYAIGTESCNRGDVPVSWYDSGSRENEHPVIAQNLFRLKTVSPGGYTRFDQIGQSWLKHGFASVNGSACGSCIQPPDGGSQLGINCSDPYGSGLNGDPGLTGRRSFVNPTTGFFAEPVIKGDSTGTATLRGRLQVPVSDTNSQPAGTRYFGETHYVTQDDAQHVLPGETVATNALNNATWQEVLASSINGSPTFTGAPTRQSAAIQAWRNADAGVTLVTVDHDDAPNINPAFPGTTIRSRFYAAGRVTDLGGGQWRYEYAIQNLNSDRAAAGFSVPFPGSGTESGFTFNHPLSHSSEPYSNAPWTMSKADGRLAFGTQTFAQNPNANALRWSTLYSLGFTANVPPTTGTATLALFKPGTAGAPTSLDIPNFPVPTPPPSCLADFNHDGNLDPDDLSDYIACYFSTPPCDQADFNDDGNTDPDDLSDYIGSYFGGC